MTRRMENGLWIMFIIIILITISFSTYQILTLKYNIFIQKDNKIYTQVIDGYGIFNKNNVKRYDYINYKVNPLASMIIIFSCETIIPPILIVGFNLYAPVEINRDITQEELNTYWTEIDQPGIIKK